MSQPPPTNDQHDDDADGEKRANRANEDATLASWYRMAGVGIEFIVAVALFAGIGYAIDRWRGSSPWGVLIGAGIGFAVGLRAMIRAANRAFRQ